MSRKKRKKHKRKSLSRLGDQKQNLLDAEKRAMPIPVDPTGKALKFSAGTPWIHSCLGADFFVGSDPLLEIRGKLKEEWETSKKAVWANLANHPKTFNLADSNTQQQLSQLVAEGLVTLSEEDGKHFAQLTEKGKALKTPGVKFPAGTPFTEIYSKTGVDLGLSDEEKRAANPVGALRNHLVGSGNADEDQLFKAIEAAARTQKSEPQEGFSESDFKKALAQLVAEGKAETGLDEDGTEYVRLTNLDDVSAELDKAGRRAAARKKALDTGAEQKARADWSKGNVQPSEFCGRMVSETRIQALLPEKEPSRRQLKQLISRMPKRNRGEARKVLREIVSDDSSQRRRMVGIMRAFLEEEQEQKQAQKDAQFQRDLHVIQKAILQSGVGFHADNALRGLLEFVWAKAVTVPAGFIPADLLPLASAIAPFLSPNYGTYILKNYGLRPEKDHYYSAQDHLEWLETDVRVRGSLRQAIDQVWSLLIPGVLYHYSSDAADGTHPVLLGTSFVLDDTRNLLYEISTLSLAATLEQEDLFANVCFITWDRKGEFVQGYVVEVDKNFYPINTYPYPSHSEAQAEKIAQAERIPLSLPAYFAYKVDLVVKTKRRTKKKATKDNKQNNTLDQDHESQEDICGEPQIDFKVVKSIRIIRPKSKGTKRKVFFGKTGVWQEPKFQVGVEGFWRKIKPQTWGHDRDGKPVLGKTWVTGHDRYKHKPQNPHRVVLVKQSVSQAKKDVAKRQQTAKN